MKGQCLTRRVNNTWLCFIQKIKDVWFPNFFRLWTFEGCTNMPTVPNPQTTWVLTSSILHDAYLLCEPAHHITFCRPLDIAEIQYGNSCDRLYHKKKKINLKAKRASRQEIRLITNDTILFLLRSTEEVLPASDHGRYLSGRSCRQSVSTSDISLLQ